MSATKQCHACREMIDAKATICSKCRSKQNSSWSGGIVVLVGMVLLLLYQLGSNAETPATQGPVTSFENGYPSTASEFANEQAAKSGGDPSMNKYSLEIAALSPEKRNDKFTEIVRFMEEKCTATRAMFNGATKDGQDFWTVDCGDQDWLVSLNGDAGGGILSCDVAAAVGGGKCWERWKS